MKNNVTRLVEYYYGADQDPTDLNAGVYMIYSENGGPMSTSPIAISIKDTGTMETLPWTPLTTVIGGGMWDYNAIGVAWTPGNFLASWGGDNRNSGNAIIETELLQ